LPLRLGVPEERPAEWANSTLHLEQAVAGNEASRAPLVDINFKPTFFAYWHRFINDPVAVDLGRDGRRVLIRTTRTPHKPIGQGMPWVIIRRYQPTR
jgi:hypothetical protein